MTWQEQLKAFVLADLRETLHSEQAEHFAWNVRDWRHAITSTSAPLDADDAMRGWLTLHLNDGCDDGHDGCDDGPEEPALRDVLEYRRLFRLGMTAALAVYEERCDGDYDPDEVTEAAIEAAERAAV